MFSYDDSFPQTSSIIPSPLVSSSYTDPALLFINQALDDVAPSLYESPSSFSFSPSNQHEQNDHFYLSDNETDWNHQKQQPLSQELSFPSLTACNETPDLYDDHNNTLLNDDQFKLNTTLTQTIENPYNTSDSNMVSFYQQSIQCSENQSSINEKVEPFTEQEDNYNSTPPNGSTTVIYDQSNDSSSFSTLMLSSSITDHQMKSTNRGSTKKGRTRKNSKNCISPKLSNESIEKRKRARAIPWSTEEQKRFEESLEIYGRDWDACSEYIGTRRPQLVRSHAQKYLIKLYKLGIPLPAKVAETGKGYTLSGKPLRADSASARSYLTRIPCPSTFVNQGEEQQKKQ